MSELSAGKKYIQVTALFLFIVGLPLGSWYYLQKGFDYNKDLMSELGNYGRIPDFKLVDQNGDTLTRAKVEGKIVVASFFNPDSDSFNKTIDYLQRMHKQFHDRKDLVFLNHSLLPGAMKIEDLKTLAKEKGLEDKQVKFLTGNKSQIMEVLSKGYQFPDLDNRDENKVIPRNSNLSSFSIEYPYFVLVDVSGTIRNYYDINSENSVTRLVEHIAIILPRKAEEKAVLKRETEK